MSGGELFEVVCTDDDPQWHAERRRLVTASVAPILLGVNRFGSKLGTYLRMREGADPEEISPERRVLMDWGTDQQDAIVANMRRRLDLEAVRTGALLRSTVYPWIGCTLDGAVRSGLRSEDLPADPIEWLRRGAAAPFEVKTTRSRTAAETWDEGVPEDVLPQVQTQLLVTGAERALVAAVVFGAPPAYAWIDRDEEMIAEIVRSSRDFFERVERGEPPEPDGSEEDDRAVDELAGERQAGKSVELDIEAVVLAEELATLEDRKKELDRQIRERKQKLVRKLGDAEEGILPGDPGGRITYRETVRKGSVKVVGLARDAVQEAIVEEFGMLPHVKITESKESRFRVLRRSKK